MVGFEIIRFQAVREEVLGFETFRIVDELSMSAYVAGVSMMLIALAVFLTGVVLLGIRALALRNRAKGITAKPAFLALDGLPGEVERIDASIQRCAPLGDRLGAVTRDLAAAAASAAGLMVDVSLVASATEDLLDTLVPSMRGVATI